MLLAARCILDGACAHPKETKPRSHPELKRYRRAGGAGVVEYRFHSAHAEVVGQFEIVGRRQALARSWVACHAALMPKRSRLPPDSNQLAAAVVSRATGETHAAPAEPLRRRKNPAAVALGRKGGKKGGKVRAAKLSKKRLSEIGKAGARARWGLEDS